MARLPAVNVGLAPTSPGTVGRSTRSVWKYLVPGHRLVKRLDIVGAAWGDLEAHGGEHRTVLVCQIESYCWYWEAQQIIARPTGPKSHKYPNCRVQVISILTRFAYRF